MERGLTVKTLEVSSRQPTEDKREKIHLMGGANAVWPGLRTIMITLSRKLGVSNSKKGNSSGTRITGQGLADHAIWNGSLTNQANSSSTRTTSEECCSCGSTTQKGTEKDSTRKRTWKLTPDQRDEIFNLYMEEFYNMQSIGDMYGIHPSSVYRIIQARRNRI